MATTQQGAFNTKSVVETKAILKLLLLSFPKFPSSGGVPAGRGGFHA